jgi:hypothetical protein
LVYSSDLITTTTHTMLLGAFGGKGAAAEFEKGGFVGPPVPCAWLISPSSSAKPCKRNTGRSDV